MKTDKEKILAHIHSIRGEVEAINRIIDKADGGFGLSDAIVSPYSGANRLMSELDKLGVDLRKVKLRKIRKVLRKFLK